MHLKAPAKINLFLDITGKDPKDNYHYIESIFTTIDLFDEIEITESIKDEIIFSNGLKEYTTVHHTLDLFRKYYSSNKSYKIYVQKNIPMGAGLGGGSSDSASVLKALCKLENVSDKYQVKIASEVGSDVTFFLYGGSAFVSGKGEKVKSLDLKLSPEIYLAILYPNIHLSTAKMYQKLDQTPKIFGKGHSYLALFMKKNILNIDFLESNQYNIFSNFLLKNYDPLRKVFDFIGTSLSATTYWITGSGSAIVLVYNDLGNVQKDLVLTRDLQFYSFFCVNQF